MIVDIIDHLIKDIRLYIPMELLLETFIKEDRNFNRSLDGIIKEKIIVDIVLRNCNIYAGKLTKITLSPSWIETTKSNTLFPYAGEYSHYRIPEEAREFRDIIYAIDLVYPFQNTYNDPIYGEAYHSLSTKTNELYESHFSGGYQTPIPRLKQNNIIYIEPPQPYHVDWLLICMLSFDSSFTNTSPNMIKTLSQMSILACKMYIYNKLKIKVDSAYLVGGSELSGFKAELESYSDAQEKFEEALMKFRGASVFDEDTSLALINFML